MSKAEPLIEKARKTNAKRDEHDAKLGLLSPTNDTIEGQIRTAILAIYAGMEIQDWDCVAEAYVMLETLRTCMGFQPL